MGRIIKLAGWVVTALAILSLINGSIAQQRSVGQQVVRSVVPQERDGFRQIKNDRAQPRTAAFIPEGYSLAVVKLFQSQPIAAQIKPGQCIDVFFAPVGSQNRAPVKRILSTVPVMAFKDDSMSLLIRNEYAETLLTAQKTGELDFTIVRKEGLQQDITKQSMTFDLAKSLSPKPTASVNSTTQSSSNNDEMVDQLIKFRNELGLNGGIRDTLNEIQKMTNQGGEKGNIADQIFREQLEKHIREKKKDR